jgi:uncharacterized membrane protein YhaH (DUF805 family)
MNYYFEALKKYAVFSGRSRRAEYWYFVLFNIVIRITLGIVGFMIGDGINISGILYSSEMLLGILIKLYGLAIFIPALAVTVRRLHDIGKSGWMGLVSFIPLIGIIWLIILLATDGNPGENKYGPDPKVVATN